MATQLGQLTAGLAILQGFCGNHTGVFGHGDGVYTGVGDEAVPAAISAELHALGWAVSDEGVWYFPT